MNSPIRRPERPASERTGKETVCETATVVGSFARVTVASESLSKYIPWKRLSGRSGRGSVSGDSIGNEYASRIVQAVADLLQRSSRGV